MKRWDSIGQAHRSWILIGLLAVFCVAPEAANYTDYPDSFGSEYEYYDYFNADCDKTFTNKTGTIESPKLPFWTPYMMICVYKINRPAGERIKISFQTVDFKDTNCIREFLEVRNGNELNAPLMGTFCQNKVPGVLTSSGNSVYLYFEFIEDSSFKLTYVGDPEICGATLTEETGTIQSPSYPNLYPNNRECVYTIYRPVIDRIRISVQSFDVQASSGCRYDYLEIRNGNGPNATLVGAYCGTQISADITFSSTALYLKFITDGSVQSTGFKLTYESKPACERTFTNETGTIESPNHPNLYPNNAFCVYKINRPTGERINISFQAFDVFSMSERCTFDYLEVRNGNGPNAPSMGYFCGTQVPAVLTSSGNSVYLQFVTDYIGGGSGFKLSYESFIGVYGMPCKVNSECQLGFICLYNKCSCINSYIYDYNKKACRKICRGYTEGVVPPINDKQRYEYYKQLYMNCTYVLENLNITTLYGKFDLSFLKDIEEVMGYVYIEMVDSNYLNLTNLRIIRGETLHKGCSLYLSWNVNIFRYRDGLMELQFTSLSEIVRGDVYSERNYKLCHVDTIKWDDINPSLKPRIENIPRQSRKPQCGQCHHSCHNPRTGESHCWGSGPDMCQKLNYVKEVCHESCDGRCFGNKQNQCCHPECAAGCNGPRKDQCFACKFFYNEGQCENFCTDMTVFDKTNMMWVPNTKGRYSLGTLCVEDCPSGLMKHLGACVMKCPPGTHPDLDKNTCRGCDGPCPKNCQGISYEERFLHSGNIGRFENCTVVEGNLKILNGTFVGDEHADIEGIRLEQLKMLSSIKEITGYLIIQEAPPELQNLSFLSNLEIIRGRDLSYFTPAADLDQNSLISDANSLGLVKLGLDYLGLTSLKEISNGHALFKMNLQLCYLEQLNITRIFALETQRKITDSNMNSTECEEKGKVCDSQCASDGCWGPGPAMCLECQNVRNERDNKCLGSCADEDMLYATDKNTCAPCHELCDVGCYGPGPEQCISCKKAEVRGDNNSSVCIDECPVQLKPPFLFPDEDRICRSCDPTCAEGCTGPSNTVKVGGCNTCELAINRTLENGSVHCLPLDQGWCPDGFFMQQYKTETNHSLNKKQVCQPCHPLCLKCTEKGTVNCQECRYYRRYSSSYSTCLDTCPSYTYLVDKVCKDCDSQCLLGCSGPNNTHCQDCRNYKIVLSNENSTLHQFACVETCPDDLPHIVKDETKDPPTVTVCADENHPQVVALNQKKKEEETKKLLTIIIPAVLGVVLLGSLLALFGYYWQRRAKAKENTAKFTAKMTGNLEEEPLMPTNAKPDVSKLRLIKESEMRRGGIIGSGAFGTVFKGFWIPEGENVKIPVAIKVLKEGASSSQNQEILEEARVMASVDNPYCIRILAVCMASQMMLITQLMPHGCLLDYIKKHKDNIGSKALLSWCTQIARGMAYLEQRGIVHRDLAARNVLVQSADKVQITDFGLAKLLDYNEDEYHAPEEKIPIKWVALECFSDRIFTHKSDVWSYGVTVWELLSYGTRPYEHVRMRDVPDLLEKGERLPQPAICTLDVYMIMLKCWMKDADSRPSFAVLSEEFAKMSRDPGRYLVIQGDELMKLQNYSYNKDDLVRELGVDAEGTEDVIEADDYIHPLPTTPENASKQPLISLGGASNKPGLIRDNLPVKYTKEKPGMAVGTDSGIAHHVSPPSTDQNREPVIQLSLNDDGYLQPKSSNPNVYLELENNKADETDSGNVLRLSSPRTDQHQESVIQIPLGEDGYLDLENNKDETDNCMALRVSPPRIRQQSESVLDADAYIQPDSLNPKAFLELENSKDETDSGNAHHVSPPRTSQHQESVIQIPLGEDGYLDLENNKDETNNGMALRVAPPRTSQQKEPLLDEDAYRQPDSSNPDAFLKLENNKDETDNGMSLRVFPPSTSQHQEQEQPRNEDDYLLKPIWS